MAYEGESFTQLLYRIANNTLGGGGGGSGGTSDATAANQTTQIARETEIRDRIGDTTSPAAGSSNALLRLLNTAFGAPADTAATTDTGAFSIVAFVKRLLGYQSTLATAALKPTAGTNLSGQATTTSGGFNLAANLSRKPGDVQGQNVSAVNIGFNEFGGTAAIGSAGTYTVPPGGTFSITTTNLVNFISASGTAAITLTGI